MKVYRIRHKESGLWCRKQGQTATIYLSFAAAEIDMFDFECLDDYEIVEFELVEKGVVE